MKFIITGIILMFFSPVFCQVIEDFSDGDITKDPAWSGTTMNFTITTDNKLQLNAPTAGSSFLFSPINNGPEMEWEFWTHLDFSPSPKNMVEYCLSCDTLTPARTGNGYFLRVGESLNGDGPDLFRRENGTEFLLIEGKNGSLSYGSNKFRIKVEKDSTGRWSLYCDTLGGNIFLKMGSVVDTTLPMSKYFGFFCEYSLSRKDKYFFDDIYAGTKRVDTFSPRIENVLPLDPLEIQVIFSEPVDSSLAVDPANYLINNGVGKPSQVTLLNGNTVAVLDLSKAMVSGISYKLTIDSLQDEEKNLLKEKEFFFLFFFAGKEDLLINEFLPDPFPSQGLPEAVFVEVYNPQNFTVELSGWGIRNLTGTYSIPKISIPPDSFVILCDISDTGLFAEYGIVAGLKSFPLLKAGGDSIFLENQAKKLVDAIGYDGVWFENSTKSMGGWSFEKINPFHPCSDYENWGFSKNTSGGTPGGRNSIYNPDVENTSPRITRVLVLSNELLEIRFNKRIDPASFDLLSTILQITPKIIISDVTFPDKNFRSAHFHLETPIKQNLNYRLGYSGFQDCFGNSAPIGFKDFVDYSPSAGDVIINEIMVDPSPPAGLPEIEYLELYNRTNFKINLNNWSIYENEDTANLGEVVIFPGKYLILCHPSDTPGMKKFGNVKGVSGFPRLRNSGGIMGLVTPGNIKVDNIFYTSGWYGDENKANGGWSLERVNPDHPCDNKGNWKACEDPSGGTPGIVNSVFSTKKDQQSPDVQDLTVLDSMTLQVIFNEKPDTATLDRDDFSVNGGIDIKTVFAKPPTYDTLIITLQNSLRPNLTYPFVYHGFSDCTGENFVEPPKVFSFIYTKPLFVERNKIIITEIMADPLPPVDLPAYEYVEVLNKENFPISLENWELETSSRSVKLPSVTLAPDSFIILCGKDHAPLFRKYGKVAPLSSWPVISNSEELIVLKDHSGRVIHSIDYSVKWFRDEFKSRGGWSIEMVDPENPCGGEDNWQPSKSQTGGTPGKLNSVDAPNPDLTSPAVSSVVPFYRNKLLVIFNEPMDSATISLRENYFFPLGLGLLKAEPLGPGFFAVKLFLEDSLEEGEKYSIEIKFVRDCSGNMIDAGISHVFGLAEDPSPGDILINEILFDPLPGGKDFVEIYNLSDKIFDLKELFLATREEGGLNIISPYSLNPGGRLLLPGDYLVLTESPENISDQYIVRFPSKIQEMKNMPGFADDEGTVVILNKRGNVVDEVHYNEDWHLSSLSFTEGISLERINFEGSGMDPLRWHSASQNAGNATPTYINSQFVSDTANNSEIKITPRIFTPDRDGYIDMVFMKYNFPKPGYSITINIFDEHGRPVKTIAENVVAGASGFFSWDGINKDHVLAGTGVYIILFEYFHEEGRKGVVKETVTLKR